MGEIEGDIPAFEKQDSDDALESEHVKKLIKLLPDGLADKMSALHEEFNAAKTPEAKLVHALDKLEAVMQHNHADLGTWIDFEYDLNLTNGQAQTAYHPFLSALRELVRQQTIKKNEETHNESPGAIKLELFWHFSFKPDVGSSQRHGLDSGTTSTSHGIIHSDLA